MQIFSQNCRNTNREALSHRERILHIVFLPGEFLAFLKVQKKIVPAFDRNYLDGLDFERFKMDSNQRPSD